MLAMAIFELDGCAYIHGLNEESNNALDLEQNLSVIDLFQCFRDQGDRCLTHGIP